MSTYSALLSIYKNDSFSTVRSCIDSLFAQNGNGFDEIIVVLEGEVDDKIIQLLSEYDRKILKTFHLCDVKGPLNYGLPSCLNYGIHVSESEYIVRIDSDDIAVPNRLEEIRSYAASNPDISLFGAHVQEFNEDMSVPGKLRKVPLTKDDIFRYGGWRNPFNGPAVVFKRKVAIQIGGYPQIASNEDYCFWALFMKLGYNVGNIDSVHVHMRAGEEIIARRRGKRYSKGEVDSIKFLYAIGWFSFTKFLFSVITRRAIRLLPLFVLKRIYSNLLRS